MSVVPIPEGVRPECLHPAVRTLFGRTQWQQRTPEWYEVRRGLMTASDAAAALGIPPFKSYRGDPRKELLKKKLDNAPLQGMFLVHGVKYEDEARDAAMEALGETCFDFGLLVHPEHTWLAASPDGITARGACVEIKCPMKRKIVVGEIPHHYYPQVQCQMEVCNMDLTYFIEYLPAHMTEDRTPFVDIKVIPRDRRWFADNVAMLKSFWTEFQEAQKTHVPSPAPKGIVCEIDDGLYV